MLKVVPPKCPICDSSWIKSASPNSPNTFLCHNAKGCSMLLLIADGVYFYLRKRFEDKTEIWWSSMGPCIVGTINSSFKDINFDPPYNITLDRLKLLILFS